MRAEPRAFTVIERREDSGSQEAGRDGVGVRHPWAVGRKIGPAHEVCEPGDRGGVKAISGKGGERTSFAEERRGDRYDVRVRNGDAGMI